MLQKNTKYTSSDFYNQYNKLGLRFPIAEIAERTGYSKGNVSDFINKKREPSRNFLDIFSQRFSNEIALLSESDSHKSQGVFTTDQSQILIEKEKQIDLLHIYINEKEARRLDIELHLKQMQAEKDKLYDIINKLQSSLDLSLTDISLTTKTLLISQRSVNSVVMKALDRLEKKKEGNLAKEAAQIEISNYDLLSNKESVPQKEKTP